jgi:two-component system sensor histidine kinase KdpD
LDYNQMNRDRPNPDELLARVQADEAGARRGKLKIFFGYAAGVGKTYAMLEAAIGVKKEGVDVVVGYVEPHARPETEALLEGFETIPPREMPYRGVVVREFDLDRALSRRPALILVDELAHTNAEGSRHAKRWQDVQELLGAGIDVWTTLNVQHVESLNDVIAQITGVIVRETLPDSVLDQANDIELIDITPEELIERLQAGKVYIPAQAERALANFFEKSNLVALREMSLRQAANRLRREVEAARQAKAAEAPWATSERLLVCVGPSPTTAKLVRTAKRMADAFHAEWLAVAVQTHRDEHSGTREKIAQHLRLAEQLGAETHTLVGEKVAQTILDYARTRNVTKVIVGKTAEPWWKRMLRGSVVEQLLERSGDIDVYVIRGEPESARAPQFIASSSSISWRPYAFTAVVVLLCTLAGWLSHILKLAEANIVMVFLLGVAFVAARYGRGPAIAASIAGVLSFDFFFVEPYFTFSVSDAQYFLTFGVMLVIGLLISTLTARQKEQLRASQEQEHRTAALYRFTKQLSEIAGEEFLVRAAGHQLGEIFKGEVVLFIRDSAGHLNLRFGENTQIAHEAINAIVAQWVTDHDQMAGAGTDTLPNATALFVPLTGSQGTVGAVGVRPRHWERLLDPDQRRLLESCASLIALSIERDRSVLEAHEARFRIQTEQMRSSLLSSVSHDLRTPLAAISGAGSSLLSENLAKDSQRELIQTIVDESHRMNRLVENLLHMTRLQAGGIVLNKQWHVLEEIIGSARVRLRKELADHEVCVNIADDFPLVLVDGLLLEQLFLNLLENAARYTPKGSHIEIRAHTEPGRVVIGVADDGPGLPPGMEQRVFEKFVRGSSSIGPDQGRGVGLGLTICRSIAEVHGGKIEARNRPQGGAEFLLTLPCREQPPTVVLDEASAPAGM